jgi:formylglycine-generating enzyme required for sulfatase activity
MTVRSALSAFLSAAVLAPLLLAACGSAGSREGRISIDEKSIGGMPFVRLRGGEFLMGFSDCGMGLAEECPQHLVAVSGFWMGRFEVTQEEYQAVMDANPSRGKKGGRYPVTNVSWKDAADYCRRFGALHGVKARLPREAEWEFACRGGTMGHFFWGDSIDGRYCWYYHNSGASRGKGGPRPVGGKNANSIGLYDMSGNVWEWCSDYYDLHYYRSSPYRDPKGPARGELRVLRGGSWNDGAYYMRSGLRNAGGADIGDEFRGFRVVLDDE